MKKIKTKRIDTAIFYPALISTLLIILIVTVISAITIRMLNVNFYEKELTLGAESKAAGINGFLSEQASIVNTLSVSIGHMDSADKDGIMDYLADNLSDNEYALMYYYCEDYDGGVYPADKSVLDLDPTTRSWWTDAFAANGLIFTEPYMDFATGQMIVTVACPVNGNYSGQACILADITIDTIVEIVGASSDEDSDVKAFLTNESGEVLAHENEEYLPAESGNTNLFDTLGVTFTSGTFETFKNYDGAYYYVYTETIESTGWIVGAYEPISQMFLSILYCDIPIVLVSAILCIIGMTLTWKQIKRALKPVGNICDFIVDKIVGPENMKPGLSQIEEINSLVDVMQESLVDVIKQTKDKSGVIRDNMENTKSRISAMNDGITDISGLMSEAGDSMIHQTESINNVNEVFNQLRGASDDLAEGAQEVAAKSEEIRSKVDEIVPALIENKGMATHRLETSRERLENAIKGVEVINQITDVTEAIRSIASETNLLALNASIEAARAGEAGRGFAVVAGEINGLSTDTEKEIEKVSTLTDEVIRNVDALSLEANEILKFMDEVVIKDYDKFEQLAVEYREDSEFFAHSGSSFGAQAEELTASVEEASSLVSDTTDEQHRLAENLENIRDNIAEITNASEEITADTGEVYENVNVLKETVDTFRI
ncbi:MAG: hypothetical protein K6G40_01815 [Eubacterium sp.]|nr:hypothetical protein [Eubacterium sp.]